MRFISILLFSCLFSQELEVEGDLKVTGNIQNQMIDSLKQRISVLESKKYSGFKNILEFGSGTYTWTAPDSITVIFVQVWAGGGGNGGKTINCSSSCGCCGDGQSGGQGGHVKNFVSVKPDSTYEIIVGGGGSRGTDVCGQGSNNCLTGGTNGQDSSFGNLIYATGGEGGCATNNNCGQCGAGACNGDSNGEAGIGVGGVTTNPYTSHYGASQSSGFMYIYY